MNGFTVAEDDGEIILDGALTIENMAEVVKKIRFALAAKDSLTVAVGAGSRADVSFLQVLCSAHRSSALAGKSFRLNAERSPLFNETVRKSGFLRKKGCTRDLDGSCLWTIDGLREGR